MDEQHEVVSFCTTRYLTSVSDVDQIFFVSKTLKEIYLTALREVSQLPDTELTRIHAGRVNQAISRLEQIPTEEISEHESAQWSKLYKQAIVLLASISEQILKDVFEKLVHNNLSSIKKEVVFSVSSYELAQNGFMADEGFWAVKLVEKLSSTHNQEEKLNFQNINTVVGVLQGYFGVDLTSITDFDALKKNVHLYFQMRHIVVHNNSIIDDNFVKNIQKAGIELHYSSGDELVLSQTDYETAKRVFGSLFEGIDALIAQMQLGVGE